MHLIENIRLALAGLRASKMRSFLTMLGIIIGISSVIAIVTVGNSLTTSITSAMAEMGANNIQFYISSREPNTWPSMADSDYMTDDMVEQFAAAFENEIESILISESCGSGQVKIGRKYANVTLFGGNESFTTNSNVDLIHGHDITARDILGAKNVIVVSNKLAERLFGSDVDALGQEISVHTTNNGILTFSIIGIYEYKPPAVMSNFVNDEDVQTQAIIPISTAKRIMGTPDGYDYIQVMFPSTVDGNSLMIRGRDFFRKYYENNTRFEIYAQNMEQMLSQMTGMLATVSVAISIIAAISLLVGGIGVMNIMLVSVTERTREIGTRKALGARNSAIRIQFVVESIIICLIGGLIGIGLGLALGSLGTRLLGFPAKPSVNIIVIAVLFSMMIGVFFGYYPANKAAKLDPIEALRYE